MNLRLNLMCSSVLILPLMLLGCNSGSGSLPPDSELPIGIPSDPSEEGKKTLAGIDSDLDGFRDDIEREAYARFPSEPEKAEAINLAGFVATELMKAGEKGDFNEALQLQGMMGLYVQCLYTFGNAELPASRLKRVADSIIFNTKDRALAFEKFGLLMDGQILSVIIDENPCESIKLSM